MKPQNLKGFRDFLPEDLKIRGSVINNLKEVFSSFGFEPLETPALEYAETLLGKYGPEADKLIYTFQDHGGRQVGLRYDLTIPLARVVAQYQNKLTFPFKRYQIQPVWRAENTQRGRYREFWQADIDIVGEKSPLADAEIVAVTYEVFKRLGFPQFRIRLNDRQILFDLLTNAGVTQPSRQLTVIRVLDKLDKKTEEEIRQELTKQGMDEPTINNIFTQLNGAQPNQNLKEIFSFLSNFQLPPSHIQFSPFLSRGLDYYTGSIFEVTAPPTCLPARQVPQPVGLTEINPTGFSSAGKPKIGSLAGGGRYDKLIQQLGGPALPATGVAFGLERIVDVLREKLPTSSFQLPASRILFCPLAPDAIAPALELAQKLRQTKKVVEVYSDTNTEGSLTSKLEKQLKYADRKGFNYAIIIGEQEVKNKMATVKNLKTGAQKEVDFSSLITNNW